MKLICSYHSRTYVAVQDIVYCIDLASEKCFRVEYHSDQGRNSQIVALLLSDDGLSLYAAYTNKWIVGWRVSSGSDCPSIVAPFSGVLCKKRPIAFVFAAYHIDRNTNAFSSFSDASSLETRYIVLIGDKAGELWGVDSLLAKEPAFCGAHTSSVITDLAITKDKKLVASCDRDEKIRVSVFPSLITIQCYCLGHTSVVTSAAFVKSPLEKLHGGDSEELLVSVGWDHQLIVWDHLKGIILSNIILPGSSSSTALDRKSDSIAGTKRNASKGESAEPLLEVGGVENTDDGDDDGEQTYDESGAGNYPLKVAPSISFSAVAVIFKATLHVSVFFLNSANDGSENGVIIKPEIRVPLPDVPIDVVFFRHLEEDYLVVTLAYPNIIRVFKVSDIFVIEIDSSADISPAFASFASDAKEFVMSPNAVSAVDEEYPVGNAERGMHRHSWDDERGMKRHALDRPFGVTEHVDNTKQSRWHKRSKGNKATKA